MAELKPPKINNGENTRPDVENLDNGETNTHHDFITFSDDFDSACSTPYVSAPSSPGRVHGGGGGGFFYSAPASPMHFILSTSSNHSSTPTPATSSVSSSFEFEFSGKCATNGSASSGSMSSADELFHNGKIRPMKLSSHLQRPQMLAPLVDLDEGDGEEGVDGDDDKVMRGRDLKLHDRSKSLRRRTRSMSPLRTSPFQWLEYIDDEKEVTEVNEAKDGVEAKLAAGAESETPASGASSRSSSVGRNSKRWVFLKEFLYRSKSEGRSSTSNGHKFWSSLSFTPAKDKKTPTESTKTTPAPPRTTAEATSKPKEGVKETQAPAKKAVNGISGKRRVTRSAHELHYAANRAQSEEMRRKTFLPYRQGVLGCLGFSSKSYGAMNGFARALNPVSSRQGVLGCLGFSSKSYGAMNGFARALNPVSSR